MTAARPRPTGESRRRPRGRSLAVLAATALAGTTALVAVPASAEPDAAGDGWTVERMGDAYEVTVELDGPLEIRAAAPTVVVDGEEVGVAVVSEDGATLTAVTDDPAVLQADEVRIGWEGEAGLDGTRPLPLTAPDLGRDVTGLPLADEPPPVSYSVGTLDYDLGPTVSLRGIPGALGELAAHVTYPVDAPGERSVVVMVHGRGPICTTSAGVAVSPLKYPCASDQIEVAAHRGFDEPARELAEQGFVVVSIVTNAVAALDASVTDRGADARASQVLAHLELLSEVEAGTAPVGAPTALRGRLDLGDVGLMGHSRGGEAVVRAAQLAPLEDLRGIRSVMLLAPTNMGRLTLPDVPTYTMLPYCDGDVLTLQGQHYFEDSRYAFDDDVLRATGLLLGANHNYFNPALPDGQLPNPPRPDLELAWVGDDWDLQIARGAPVDPACSAGVEGSQRLSPSTQGEVLTAYASAWFRLTLEGQRTLLPLFDGSNRVPADLWADGVEVSTVASAPTSSRVDVAPLVSTSEAFSTIGTGTTAQICASLPGAPYPSSLPTCADRPPSAAPHWAPTLNAASTPAGRMLRLDWTAPGGGVAFTLPDPVDATDLTTLSLRATLSPDSTSVPDMDIVIVDADGRTAAVRASTLGTALNPLPGSVAPMAKTVLRTVAVPVDALPGIDRTRIAGIRLEGRGASGSVLVSDVALSRPEVGVPGIGPRPRLSVVDVEAREGNGPGLALVPVRLNAASGTEVTVSVEAVTSRGADAQPIARSITFAPWQTCAVLPVALVGDRAQSNVSRRSTVVSAVAINGAVGEATTSLLTVLEDDGAPATRTQPATPPLPPETTVRTDPCGRTSGELFRDVPDSMLFHESMAWLAVTGVTTGWPTAGRPEYRPLAPVARDAMAAFLYRFAGSPAYAPPSTSPFVDVATTNVYYKEIAWLRDRGISTGWTTAAGREFRPYEPVERDAMAAFLYRFAGSPAFTTPAVSPFDDVRATQEHFKEMAWVSAANVSTGWTENGRREYRSSLPVARDAMAAFLERLTRIP